MDKDSLAHLFFFLIVYLLYFIFFAINEDSQFLVLSLEKFKIPCQVVTNNLYSKMIVLSYLFALSMRENIPT